MPRRTLLLLSLAALAACSDPSPITVPFTGDTTERSFTLRLTVGDSVDLAAMAAYQLGMHGVADCASNVPDIATLLASDQLLAVTAGESVVTCIGAVEGGTEPTIIPLDDPSSGGWAWVPFTIHVTVLAPQGPDGETTDSP